MKDVNWFGNKISSKFMLSRCGSVFVLVLSKASSIVEKHLLNRLRVQV